MLHMARRRLGPLGWGAVVMFVLYRLGDVSQLAAKIILGRWLGEIDFGAVEPFTAVFQLAVLPAAVLYAVATKSISRLQGVQRMGACGALVRDLACISVVGTLLTVAITLALRSYILVRLHLDGMVYIWILAGLLALGWWSPLAMAVAQGMLRYRLIPILLVLGPFVAFGCTALFVVAWDMALVGALLARVVAPVITLAIFAWAIRGVLRMPREPYTEERRAMVRMLLPMGLYLASYSLLYRFDTLFVRHYLLEASAGYGAVVTLGQIPLWLIAPLVFVIFPLAAAEHAGGRAVGRVYGQALLGGGGVGLLCTAALAWTAEPLLHLWDPAKFTGYGMYVWPYAIGITLQGLIQIVASVEMARHRYRFLWVLVPGTLGMLAWLYPRGANATIEEILVAMVLSRLLILLGMLALSLRGFRPDRGAAAAR